MRSRRRLGQARARQVGQGWSRKSAPRPS